MDPSDVEKTMRKHVISQTKLQNKTLARNELSKLKFIGTNDVKFTTKKVIKVRRKSEVRQNFDRGCF